MIRYNSLVVSEKLFCHEPEVYYETTAFFCYITIAFIALVVFLCCTIDRDGFSHRLIFFHGRSIFWKTLFSLPSLPYFLTFVLILSTCDCNVDIFEQVLYQVNDLVLCRISTTLALWPTKIITVYTIMLVNHCFPQPFSDVSLVYSYLVLWNKARAMKFHNFWCISFVSSEFLKHVQKTPKSWEKVCSITICHQNLEKTLLQAWKPLKMSFFLPTSFSDNHGQKSWDTFVSQLLTFLSFNFV